MLDYDSLEKTSQKYKIIRICMPITFQAATRTILRPIIKMMLLNGVDLAEFVSIVRTVYVDVAHDGEFAVTSKSGAKKKISISRIAALTGLNRKEVSKLVDRQDSPPEKGNTNRAVRVISGWTLDDRFCDNSGEPKALPYGSKSESNSFETLVKDYSGDTTARVILDELMRVGSVTRDDAGKIHLIEKGYIPTLGDKELLDIGSKAISDLAGTVSFNINKPKDMTSMLQLSVSYSAVPDQGKSMYRSILKKDATDFINQQNKILSSLDRSQNPDIDGSGNYRIGVGIYYFEDTSDE